MREEETWAAVDISTCTLCSRASGRRSLQLPFWLSVSLPSLFTLWIVLHHERKGRRLHEDDRLEERRTERALFDYREMGCSLHLFAWLDFRTKASVLLPILTCVVVTQKGEWLKERHNKNIRIEILSICFSAWTEQQMIQPETQLDDRKKWTLLQWCYNCLWLRLWATFFSKNFTDFHLTIYPA